MSKDLERLDQLLTDYAEWPPEHFDGAKDKWRSIELELINIISLRRELLTRPKPSAKAPSKKETQL